MLPAPTIGDPAPALTLPDLTGTMVERATLRGHTTLVLFWNPDCGFCQQMLPDLPAGESQPPPGAPQLLVVSTGTVKANQAQGLRSPVVLDQDFTARRLFGLTCQVATSQAVFETAASGPEGSRPNVQRSGIPPLRPCPIDT